MTYRLDDYRWDRVTKESTVTSLEIGDEEVMTSFQSIYNTYNTYTFFHLLCCYDIVMMSRSYVHDFGNGCTTLLECWDSVEC